MTIIYADGFDSYNNIADLNRRWTTTPEAPAAGVVYSNVGRNGVGRRFSFNSDLSDITRGLWATKTVVYVGFAYRNADLGVSAVAFDDIFTLLEGGTRQCGLGRPPNSGQLAFYRQPGVGTNIQIGAASSRVLRNNVWYYIEAKFTLSNTLSTAGLVLRVNGETWLSIDSGDSVASGNEWTDSFRFGRVVGSSATVDIDDFYILDSAGPAPYNTFLGDLRVDTIRPNGNGTTSNFVGSDADSTDNYLLVDDITPDGDTTYLKSSTPTDIDLHALESLPVTPQTIFGVQPVSVCKKTDAGVRTAQHAIRTGGTNYFSPDFYPSDQDYIGFSSLGGSGMWEDNPFTGVPFVEADIDALESGIKLSL